MIAGMFASYGYLAAYLDKITHMNGAQVSIMLLLFGGTGIAGNWLAGIALSKNPVLTLRVFLFSLIIIHILAYTFGGSFFLMAGIISLWGFVHTAGFLIGQTRSTSEAPEAPELAASLMVSFGNAGVTAGTLLGGFVITHYGMQHITWMSIALFIMALGISSIVVKKRAGQAEVETEVSMPAGIEAGSMQMGRAAGSARAGWTTESAAIVGRTSAPATTEFSLLAEGSGQSEEESFID